MALTSHWFSSSTSCSASLLCSSPGKEKQPGQCSECHRRPASLPPGPWPGGHKHLPQAPRHRVWVLAHGQRSGQRGRSKRDEPGSDTGPEKNLFQTAWLPKREGMALATLEVKAGGRKHFFQQQSKVCPSCKPAPLPTVRGLVSPVRAAPGAKVASHPSGHGCPHASNNSGAPLARKKHATKPTNCTTNLLLLPSAPSTSTHKQPLLKGRWRLHTAGLNMQHPALPSDFHTQAAALAH